MEIIKSVLKRKEDGIANAPICLLCILCLVIAYFFCVSYKSINITKNQLDNGLTVSGLAALIIDGNTYVETQEAILNPQKAYDAFMETLKINLDLNDNMETNNQAYYKKVDLLQFIIYNVVGNNIEVIKCTDGTFNKEVHENGLGRIEAVNGETITSSSLYIKLGITYDVFMLPEDKYGTVDNLLAVDSR